MKLKEIEIQNFLGIGSGKLSLDRKGITLIDGINHDSPSSSSNGAGKSSVFESVYFSLFGKTKRGLTGDDVISRKTGKNCHVTLIFEVKGRTYKVTRARKDKEFGTNLLLSDITDPENPILLTKGTAKDTQATLEEILGFSDLTFSKIAYFGQGDVKDFATLTDKELKEVFEQSLGLTFFGEYLDKIKKKVSDLNMQQSMKSGEIDRAKDELGHVETQIELLKKHESEFESQRAEQIGDMQAQIRKCNDELSAIAFRASSGDEYEKRLKEYEEQEKKLARLQKLKSELDAAYRVKSSEFSKAKAYLEMRKSDIAKTSDKIKESRGQVGKPCEMCGRVFSEGDIESLVAHMEKHLAEAKSGEVADEAAVRELAEKAEQLSGLIEKLTVETNILAEAKVAMGVLEAEHKAVISQRDRINETINMLSDTIANLKKKTCEASGKIAELKGKTKEISEVIVAKGKELSSIARDAETASLLQEIFSAEGMKTHVFDSITPELNRIIAEFMGVMDEFDIEISTVTKLKGGGVRDKFSIRVDNPHGSDKYEGNSGGERQKINISIALAFNRLVRNMADNPIDFMFLDEPFESLDATSSESVIELCSRLAAENSLFVVTHNEAIKDLISSRIIVEKKDGQSVIRE